MKKTNFKKTLVAIVLTVFQFTELMANKNNPPTPRGGFDDSVVVGGAIDNYLPLLFFMALILATWVLNKKTKAHAIK